MHRRCWLLVAAGVLAASCTPAMAKDIFVSAGSNDGDGSREAPYGEISVALGKAEEGDKIHVSQGVYCGPKGAAAWRIGTRFLTLAGGYSADFSKRDPWRYPTLLVRGTDADLNVPACTAAGCKHPLAPSQAPYSPGPLVGQLSWADAEGFVLDGFVLDGHTRNRYDAQGMMDVERSPATPVVAFSSPEIKIRSCLIVNGGQGIRLSGKRKNEVANCLIVNTVGRAIDLRGKDAVVKGNSILFVWGTGKEPGCGVHVGQAENMQLQKNVFAFVAGTAVDTHATEPAVTLQGNVFCGAGRGIIQYLSGQEKTPATAADPAQVNGGGAVRAKTTRDSSGNKGADLAVAAFGDAGVLERFAAAAKGPVTGAAVPLMRWEQALLFTKDAAAAKAGAQQAGPFEAYREMMEDPATDKQYARVRYADVCDADDLKPFYGKDVEMVAVIRSFSNNDYMAAKGLTEDAYRCAEFSWESARKNLYGYVRAKTPSLALLGEAYQQGQTGAGEKKKFVLLKGTLMDASNLGGSMYTKVVLVIDKADFASDEEIEEATKAK